MPGRCWAGAAQASAPPTTLARNLKLRAPVRRKVAPVADDVRAYYLTIGRRHSAVFRPRPNGAPGAGRPRQRLSRAAPVVSACETGRLGA